MPIKCIEIASILGGLKQQGIRVDLSRIVGQVGISIAGKRNTHQ
jgi:hypothetical protein